MKLYFIGGEDVEKRNSIHINKKAFREAGEAPTVLVFPWTSNLPAKEDKYRRILPEYFGDLGARVVFTLYSESVGEIRNKMKNSDVIYLPGGLPEILMEKIREKNLVPDFRKYDKIVIGNSAGALAMCKEYLILKGQDGVPNSKFLNGLGLADFVVSVHYGSSDSRFFNPGLYDELKRLSQRRKIYAISERSALVYDGKDMKFMGGVYSFYKGKRTECR